MSGPEVEPDALTIVLVDDDLFGLNRLDHLISGLAGSRIMCCGRSSAHPTFRS